MVKGWMGLEFDGQSVIRLEPGDSVFIPDGLCHNKLCASDNFELSEASIPTATDTVACEAPKG